MIGYQGNSQSNFGISIGTSRTDNHTESIWYQKSFSEKFSLGFQLRNGGINYRFINARAVQSGSVQHAGLVLGYKIRETENFRFDFNLSTTYRRINSDDVEVEGNGTNGFEPDFPMVDPFSVAFYINDIIEKTCFSWINSHWEEIDDSKIDVGISIYSDHI